MKKLLCVAMALCLMLTAVAALAEAAPALNWADFEPILEAGEVSGQFYTFDEIAVKIWLPEGVAVVYVDVNGMSLEEYGGYLSTQADATEVEVGTVNGFPCVSYKLPEQDSVSITFTTEAGYALEVTCTPLSEENAELVWGAVIASIQAE